MHLTKYNSCTIIKTFTYFSSKVPSLGRRNGVRLFYFLPYFPEDSTVSAEICRIIYTSVEVLLRVSEQRNILLEIRKRKANWIGHILRRNCFLKQVIGGKTKGRIEVTRRRGRRHKQLLDDLGDRRGYSHLKEEALDRIKWRNRFGRGCGPVVWQITDDDE
jgi:hypothetical protein